MCVFVNLQFLLKNEVFLTVKCHTQHHIVTRLITLKSFHHNNNTIATTADIVAVNKQML